MFDQYVQIKLVEPIDKNLAKKKEALKQVKDGFEAVLRYEIGETTAAASYYLGEMYYDFNRSLVESSARAISSAAEKEQYELALEEQAFPFEERAIDVHQKNTDLVKLGIYNKWVEKSFGRLATLVARALCEVRGKQRLRRDLQPPAGLRQAHRAPRAGGGGRHAAGCQGCPICTGAGNSGSAEVKRTPGIESGEAGLAPGAGGAAGLHGPAASGCTERWQASQQGGRIDCRRNPTSAATRRPTWTRP